MCGMISFIQNSQTGDSTLPYWDRDLGHKTKMKSKKLTFPKVRLVMTCNGEGGVAVQRRGDTGCVPRSTPWQGWWLHSGLLYNCALKCTSFKNLSLCINDMTKKKEGKLKQIWLNVNCSQSWKFYVILSILLLCKLGLWLFLSYYYAEWKKPGKKEHMCGIHLHES